MSNALKLDQLSTRSRLNLTQGTHKRRHLNQSVRNSVQITNLHEITEMLSPARDARMLMMSSVNWKQDNLSTKSFMNETSFSKNPLSNTSYLPPAEVIRKQALRTPVSAGFPSLLSPQSNQGKRDLAAPNFKPSFLVGALQKRSRERNHSNLEPVRPVPHTLNRKIRV